MNIVTQSVLIPPSALISAAGTVNGPDLNVQGNSGFAEIGLQATNTSGTNPTLSVLLQHSLPLNNTIGPQLAIGAATPAGLPINSVATTNQQQGAVFTTGSVVQSLKTVTASFYGTGAIPANSTVTCYLYATAANVPSGAAVATSVALNITTTLPASAVSAATAAPFTFTFLTPYDMSAATVYGVGFGVSYVTSGANYLSVQSWTVGSAGNSVIYNNTTWSAVATSNVGFLDAVYVFTTYQDYQIATPGGAQTLTNKTIGTFSGALAVQQQQTPFYPQNTQGVIRAQLVAGGTTPAYTVAAQVGVNPVNSVPFTSV